MSAVLVTNYERILKKVIIQPLEVHLGEKEKKQGMTDDCVAYLNLNGKIFDFGKKAKSITLDPPIAMSTPRATAKLFIYDKQPGGREYHMAFGKLNINDDGLAKIKINEKTIDGELHFEIINCD